MTMQKTSIQPQNDEPTHGAHREGAYRTGIIQRLAHRHDHRHEHPPVHQAKHHDGEPWDEAQEPEDAWRAGKAQGPQQFSMVGTGLCLWQDGGSDEVREVGPRIPGDQHHERMYDNPSHAFPGPAPETRGKTGEENDPNRLPGGAGVRLDLLDTALYRGEKPAACEPESQP